MRRVSFSSYENSLRYSLTYCGLGPNILFNTLYRRPLVHVFRCRLTDDTKKVRPLWMTHSAKKSGVTDFIFAFGMNGWYTWRDNKVRKLTLEGFFIMNLYQLDKRSTKFTIWKYWKGCVKKFRRKQPELFANNSWILHHENAPAHTALSVREFLATKQITVLEHPAYSPDLAPHWLFSVPEDKGNIERKAFWWHQSNTTAALKAMPQNQFQNCFEGWTRRWHRCIASQGECVEGDHGGIQ